MRRYAVVIAIAGSLAAAVTTAAAQPATVAERTATRDRLRALLTSYGPRVNITDFHQNEKVEWNISGNLRQGLKNADYIEVVAGVTDNRTISINCYPHYKGAYINLDKARNPALLLRRMVNLTYHNYLGWAADDTGDIMARFQITLESGFPEEGIQAVLRSIVNLDQFVGQMRPDIDGSNP